MPLILISGYPKSGKTHRAQQLISDFTTRISTSPEPRIQRLKVIHISDTTLALSRTVYSAARPEKDARAAFTSAIKRALSKDTLVIADGLNYIKGFRYQLYCEAKALQTPNCVVHVGTTKEKCTEINEVALQSAEGQEREGDSAPYDPEVFTNLLFRYEEPNGMARWDAPLFTVPWDDAAPPFEAIWEAMVGTDGKAKVVRQNAATVLKPASEQDYLYELDKTTSEVIGAITAWTADHPGEGGGTVRVAGAEGEIILGMTAPGVPQLQRLRRQFIQLNRQHALGKSRVRDLFVDYLNDAFQK